jgi:hypothetical protein
MDAVLPGEIACKDLPVIVHGLFTPRVVYSTKLHSLAPLCMPGGVGGIKVLSWVAVTLPGL